MNPSSSGLIDQPRERSFAAAANTGVIVMKTSSPNVLYWQAQLWGKVIADDYASDEDACLAAARGAILDGIESLEAVLAKIDDVNGK